MPLILRPRARVPIAKAAKGYAIADARRREFARAYEALVGRRLSPAEQDAVLNAIAQGNARAVLEAIPLVDPNDPRWVDLSDEVQKVYRDVLAKSGAAEVKRLGFDMDFTLDNPYSRAWIDAQTGVLIKDVSEGQIKAVRAAVDRGFELGLPPREMAKTIETVVGLDERYANAVMNRLNLHLGSGMAPDLAVERADRYARALLRDRAERIARTETIAAEAEGLVESWRVAGDEGFMPTGAQKTWIEASGSERTCEACEELGSMDPIGLDEEWYSEVLEEDIGQPPAHPHCLPGDALITARGSVSATTERRYDGDLVVIRTASGKQLACTPNHPVLTRGGWVPARLAHIGGYIVSTRGGERVPLIDMQHEDVPTTIEQVAQATRRARHMTAAPVPTTAEDFHGDGGGSKIAVVWTDRQLRHGIDAARAEHSRQAYFRRAYVGAFILAALRSAAQRFVGDFAPSPSGVRLPSQAQAVAARCSRHSLEHRRAAVSRGHSAGKQAETNGAAADTEEFRAALLGHTSVVELDQVIDVNVLSFHGHVLNLETSSGAFVANGVVTHNCRCSLGLVLPE